MIGIILIVVGMLLRIISYRTLGSNFRFLLITPDKITTTGIYKYIRHPAYLGSLLMILGLSLINPVLGITAMAFAFFIARITDEEYVLMMNKDYEDYRKTTSMLIPKLRRK